MPEETLNIMPTYLRETLILAKKKHFKSMEHYLAKHARKFSGRKDLGFTIKVRPEIIISLTNQSITKI